MRHSALTAVLFALAAGAIAAGGAQAQGRVGCQVARGEMKSDSHFYLVPETGTTHMGRAYVYTPRAVAFTPAGRAPGRAAAGLGQVVLRYVRTDGEPVFERLEV